MTLLLEMDVVLLERQLDLESVGAKRRFAAKMAVDDQRRRKGERSAAKAGGAVRKLTDLLRPPAGRLSSAGSSGQ